jgi:hypothetical protein
MTSKIFDSEIKLMEIIWECEPQSAKSIVKYAYKPGKKPEIASIRTHISVMNRKFREITGKNLFVGIEKEGYVVSTPEILASLT